MELKDYIGKEVEVTLHCGYGTQYHMNIRTEGLIVKGYYNDDEHIFLRHNIPTGWIGMAPNDKEEGYEYWGLNCWGYKWYEDIRLLGSITPRYNIRKHKMIWN